MKDGIFLFVFLPISLLVLIVLTVWVILRDGEHSQDIATNGAPAIWVPNRKSPAGPLEKYRFTGSFVGLGFQQPSPSYNSNILSTITPVQTGDDITCYYQDEILAQLYENFCVGSYGNCISADGSIYSPGDSVEEYMSPSSSSTDDKISRCSGDLAFLKTRNRCVYYNGTFFSDICNPANQNDIFVILSLNLSSVIKNGIDVALANSSGSGNLLQIFNRNTNTALDVDTSQSTQGILEPPLLCNDFISGNVYPLKLTNPENMTNMGYVWLMTPPLMYCPSGAVSGGLCSSGQPITIPQMIIYVAGINLQGMEIFPNPTLILSQQILEFIARNGGAVLVNTNNNYPGVMPLADVLNSITTCNAPSVFAQYHQPGTDTIL